MKYTKLTILILTLAVLAVISGCARKQPSPETRSATSTTTSSEQIATTTSITAATSSPEKYQGELTNEENGWKHYVNKNWGIEFRFMDRENKFNILDLDDQIRIGDKIDLHKAQPYI
ncbi:MAG: hypothetical protein PHT51_05180 [Patescibacteria group bacterium]|nr:hypothetical protein [Patescibacteria group bacterium]MDD4611213.1 hypothetical protein [Patescibacteria group bacterium]